MINPNDAKSAYNQGLIKDKLAALPKNDSAAGEYWKYVGLANWKTLNVKSKKNKSDYLVDFQGYYFGMMALYYGPNAGYGPNTSEFSAIVTMKNNKGVIALGEDEYTHCNISLTVTPEGINAITDDPQNCRLGAHVSADGYYLRFE
jgi:hypothetical protein